MDVFAETFPNNGCLCWLQNSRFQQTCHNIIFPPAFSGFPTEVLYAFLFFPMRATEEDRRKRETEITILFTDWAL
jgi:hypothetical protein